MNRFLSVMKPILAYAENYDPFEGVLPNLARRFRETASDMIREQIENYMTPKACPTCQGARLRQESWLSRWAGKTSIM